MIRFVIIKLGIAVLIHYFATTHYVIVGNFIVCKNITSVTRIFRWRLDATTFRFLKTIHWPTEQTSNLSTKNKQKRIPVDGAKEKEKEDSIVLLLTLKWNVFAITPFKVVVFYLSIPFSSMCNESIQIETNLSMDWYW